MRGPAFPYACTIIIYTVETFEVFSQNFLIDIIGCFMSFKCLTMSVRNKSTLSNDMPVLVKVFSQFINCFKLN